MSGAKVQDEIDRYGDKIFDVDLPFCPSASQGPTRVRSGTVSQAWPWYVTHATVEYSDGEENMRSATQPLTSTKFQLFGTGMATIRFPDHVGMQMVCAADLSEPFRASELAQIESRLMTKYGIS